MNNINFVTCIDGPREGQTLRVECNPTTGKPTDEQTPKGYKRSTHTSFGRPKWTFVYGEDR